MRICIVRRRCKCKDFINAKGRDACVFALASGAGRSCGDGLRVLCECRLEMLDDCIVEFGHFGVAIGGVGVAAGGRMALCGFPTKPDRLCAVERNSAFASDALETFPRFVLRVSVERCHEIAVTSTVSSGTRSSV